jgi:hypothetical protein
MRVPPPNPIRVISLCNKCRVVDLEEAGRGLHLETPIGLDGTLSINYRPDPSFAYGLNLPGVFSGTIVNRENIGKTGEELVVMWNEANPEDRVELPAN